MIAIDASPLRFGPPSVARMLRGWLQGWPAGAAVGPPHLLEPGAERPARFRRRLPARLQACAADALLVPWMAVPDLRALELPVVATIHELPWVRHGPVEGRVRMGKQRWWLRRMNDRCAAVLVPSEATRADAAEACPALAERLHVVPHGFDPTPWEAARREPEDPPYAVMVGTGQDAAHAHKKGLDLLLAAWSRAAPPGWRLVLAGRAPRRVPQGIDIVEAPGDDALRTLVAGASLLVYPSRMEGFGFPPLEAMAAGTPVLTTDAGSIPEVVGDAAHLVPAGDAAALAEGLRTVAGDAALRAALRTRGRERARAFAPADAGRAIVAIFAALGVPA